MKVSITKKTNNKNMKKREVLINFLEELTYGLCALFVWSAYKAKFISYRFDGLEFKYERYMRPRWYSPLYWLHCIIYLIGSIFSIGLVAGFKGITNEYKPASERNTEGFEARFKDTTSFLKKYYLLWRYIYFFI